MLVVASLLLVFDNVCRGCLLLVFDNVCRNGGGDGDSLVSDK